MERALRRFLRRGPYSDPVPLMLPVRHVPGEPVSVDQTLGIAYEPFTTGTVCGKPRSTSWFRPGFTGDGPGFQAQGLCTTPRASPSRAFTRASGI